MKLSEIQDRKSEILAWLKKNAKCSTDFIIDDDEVSAVSSVEIKGRVTEMGVQFDSVDGSFLIVNGNGRQCELISLKGCPRSCDELDCSYSKITSLEFAPEDCNAIHAANTLISDIKNAFPHIKTKLSYLDLGGNPITSWINVHELCKFPIEEINVSINETTVGGLGLLLLNGLQKILIDWDGEEAAKAAKILEKYAGHPEKIYECQNELLDAGLDRFAQL